ncbi:MAG: hypothetical protein KAX38_01835, partial [Candidatus Krumholzibacteria bacterium]|nr:hypothetical protein [Candidatus Krumholzibacteria bacterium]
MALYNFLLPFAVSLAKVAASFNPKIAEGFKERKNLRESWKLGSERLARNGPLVWFHVSSVGEFEQAKPVMDLLTKRIDPSLEIALTFFSPSGMNYFSKFDLSEKNPSIRFVDYLPIDTTGNVRFCLDTLRPDLIAYVKFDLWPNLITEASRRGIPQILISGTLAPNSKRLSKVSRNFYGNLYSKLSAIAAISNEDRDRFMKYSGGDLDVITAGDTRFDQVCRRIDTSTTSLPETLLANERSFLIAGSTWPKDEEIVIPGFKRLIEKLQEIVLILVPHEPTPKRLLEIEQELKKSNLPFHPLSSISGSRNFDGKVIVADGVGYLAELYRMGSVAYVGGSFTTGVHNVMEPAVLGLPVLFGPRIENSYEARRLLELGAAKVVRTP